MLDNTSFYNVFGLFIHVEFVAQGSDLSHLFFPISLIFFSSYHPDILTLMTWLLIVFFTLK